MTDGSRHAAVGFAVSRRCDLLVAVAQGEGDAGERAACGARIPGDAGDRKRG